jgi:hypothetical protein
MTGATSSLGIATSVDVLMATALYLSFATGSLFILPIGSMAVGAYTFGWLTVHALPPWKRRWLACSVAAS